MKGKELRDRMVKKMKTKVEKDLDKLDTKSKGERKLVDFLLRNGPTKAADMSPNLRTFLMPLEKRGVIKCDMRNFKWSVVKEA